MNDTIDVARVAGDITLDGEDIYDKRVDPVQLRAKVGMVFQKPNPFPKSIYENVAYGPKIHGLARNKAELDEIVETSLRRAALWDEAKDRLDQPGTGLSGGQQQRLCIARAVATNPEVLLMDEPCSALDPIATAQVEELIDELRTRFSVVIVTHSMQQAARVSQKTAIFPPRRTGRIRRHVEDFHQPRRSAHRKLHHRPDRLSASFRTDIKWFRRNISSLLSTAISRRSRRPSCAWAASWRTQSRNRRGRWMPAIPTWRAACARVMPPSMRLMNRSTRRPRASSHSVSPSPPICARCCRCSAFSSNLERIGDYAKNIAKRSEVILDHPPVDGTGASLRRMARQVELMLKDVLDAYIQRDADKALDVRERDLEVDQMYSALFREYLTFMMEDPRNISTCMHLHFMAKNIERMGDHATSIAEQVIYLVTGEMPEEDRPKQEHLPSDGAAG